MVALFLLLALLQATPTPPKPSPTNSSPTTAKAPRPRPSTTTTTAQLFITDTSGRPIEGVTVSLMGPVDREVKSPASGPTRIDGLRAGTYRVRFSHDGFIAFERNLLARRHGGAGAVGHVESRAGSACPAAAAGTHPEARAVDVEAAAAGRSEVLVVTRLHREELHLRARAAKGKPDRLLGSRPDDAVADSRSVERTGACVS